LQENTGAASSYKTSGSGLTSTLHRDHVYQVTFRWLVNYGRRF